MLLFYSIDHMSTMFGCWTFLLGLTVAVAISKYNMFFWLCYIFSKHNLDSCNVIWMCARIHAYVNLKSWLPYCNQNNYCTATNVSYFMFTRLLRVFFFSGCLQTIKKNLCFFLFNCPLKHFIMFIVLLINLTKHEHQSRCRLFFLT